MYLEYIKHEFCWYRSTSEEIFILKCFLIISNLHHRYLIVNYNCYFPLGCEARGDFLFVFAMVHVELSASFHVMWASIKIHVVAVARMLTFFWNYKIIFHGDCWLLLEIPDQKIKTRTASNEVNLLSAERTGFLWSAITSNVQQFTSNISFWNYKKYFMEIAGYYWKFLTTKTTRMASL